MDLLSSGTLLGADGIQDGLFATSAKKLRFRFTSSVLAFPGALKMLTHLGTMLRVGGFFCYQIWKFVTKIVLDCV